MCCMACAASVAGRDDGSRLDHQDDRALWGARAMHDALGDDETLARRQFHHSAWRHSVRALLEIDEEPTFDDVEELVVGVVLMPVILALHDAEAYDRVVDAGERLVVPR